MLDKVIVYENCYCIMEHEFSKLYYENVYYCTVKHKYELTGDYDMDKFYLSKNDSTFSLTITKLLFRISIVIVDNWWYLIHKNEFMIEYLYITELSLRKVPLLIVEGKFYAFNIELSKGYVHTHGSNRLVRHLELYYRNMKISKILNK